MYLVENPPHNLKGDFSLQGDICVRGPGFTFSGAAMYKCKEFEGKIIEKKPLLPYFEKWSKEKSMQGSLLQGKWFDVGTIERLNMVNDYIKAHNL